MPAPAQIPGLTPAGPSLFPFDAQRTPASVQGRAGGAPLRVGTDWFVRVGGSNANGGTSASLTPERNGTDGVTNNTTTFTSASAAFTQADVGKGITYSGSNRHHLIASVTNSTTVLLNVAATTSASGQTWAIGGAFGDLSEVLGNGGFTTSPWWLVGTANNVYIGAGTYRAVYTQGGTAGVNPTLNYVGDVDGARTGDAGMVQLTAYTTNDKTAPSGTTLLNLNGKSNLTFQNIMFVGGTAVTVTATTATSQNITFRNCGFQSGGISTAGGITATSAYGMPLNWLIDSCSFIGFGSAVTVTPTTSAAGGSDYDVNFVVQNSYFLGGSTAIVATQSGVAAFHGGGVRVRSCFFTGQISGVVTAVNANYSTKIPLVMTGCFVQSGVATAINASVAGQVIEDYNLLLASTPRTNVSIGAHSISDGSYAPLFHFGQERIWGGTQRPFGEPMASSPLNAFGVADTSAGLVDGRGAPRPTTAARWAVGALQRAGNFTQTTATTHTGGSALTVVGDGAQDFDVPVDAGAVTFSAFLRYSSAYTGPLPQLTVLANGQVGVSQTTALCSTNALNAWEQVSVTVNPTAGGILTVRVVSGDDSGVGSVFADSFAVA